MGAFHQDVRERRGLARNAKYKKNGSKSKRCTLPSDYLTPGQIKKLSKDVVTVNFNYPVRYETFKKMSNQLKAEYIDYLCDRYNVTLTRIAQMMGCTNNTMKSRIKEIGKSGRFKRGKKMSEDDVQKWEAYLRCEVGSPPIVATESVVVEEPESEPAPPIVQDVSENISVEELTEKEPKQNALTRCSLEYDGNVDLSDMLNEIMYIIGSRTMQRLRVTVEM